MIENAFYTQENHGPFHLYELGDFSLEEGGVIPECKLAYATHGQLNAEKTNAILVPTWFSGTSKDYESYIGEGRALDPNLYFIIVVNQLGNGLSSSPHNSPAPIGMSNFPHVRIGDDVRAQYQFITEHFGLTELALVVGDLWAPSRPMNGQSATPTWSNGRHLLQVRQKTRSMILSSHKP